MFIRKRLLQKIKKRLKTSLPNFAFNIILISFRKIKLLLRWIIPQPVLNLVYLLRRRIICEYINFKYRNYSMDKLAKVFYKKDYHIIKGYIIVFYLVVITFP